MSILRIKPSATMKMVSRSETVEIIQTSAMRIQRTELMEILETERERTERNYSSEVIEFFEVDSESKDE